MPLLLDWGGESCFGETSVVSESGALVLAPGQFLPGLILELCNRLTGDKASARVVSCGSHPDAFGLWQVGMALLDQRRGFFRVPEADAAPRGHERRRSQRIFLGHGLELLLGGVTFAARTRVVNRHGALVLSTRSGSAGEVLCVRNLESGQTRSARVVVSRPAESLPGNGFDLAFEFESPPSGFWVPDYRDS